MCVWWAVAGWGVGCDGESEKESCKKTMGWLDVGFAGNIVLGDASALVGKRNKKEKWEICTIRKGPKFRKRTASLAPREAFDCYSPLCA